MNLIKAFTVTLFLANATLTTYAQQRYEQMIVLYDSFNRLLRISMDSGEHREVTIPKSESKNPYDASPALAEVKQLAEQGWEHYDNAHSIAPTGQHIFIFYLRKLRQ